jgi:hypothetical protein
MWRKFFYKKEKDKWEFKPNRFFTTLFLALLFAGVWVKWFILLNIETGDLGVLAIPILGLIGNLMKNCFRRREEVSYPINERGDKI